MCMICCFQHIYRETNMVANSLTRKGHSTDNTSIWFYHLPVDISYRINFDLYGHICSSADLLCITFSFQILIIELILICMVIRSAAYFLCKTFFFEKNMILLLCISNLTSLYL